MNPVDSFRKTRAYKRAVAKDKWQNSSDNIRHSIDVAKTVAKNRLPDIVDISTLSVDDLRIMMRNDDEDLPRRIDAAECVLGYELPPAALAQGSIDPASSEAYILLKKISKITEIPSVLRFRVLRSLSVIESAKPRKIDPQAAEDERRREVRLINSMRRAALQSRGLWPVHVAGWAIEPDDELEKSDASESKQLAGRAPEQYLALRLKNRPDPFHDLLSGIMPYGQADTSGSK